MFSFATLQFMLIWFDKTVSEIVSQEMPPKLPPRFWLGPFNLALGQQHAHFRLRPRPRPFQL